MLESSVCNARQKWRRRWFPLRPHAKQQALYRCSKRFIGVAAARRSGKTELAKRKLVSSLSILKPWTNPRYFYAAPTEGQAKKLAWDDLVELTPPGWIEGEPHQSELYIKTKFGSSIHIIGLDKPQRAEGFAWDGGVIDESSDVRPDAISLSLGPGLMDREGWMWRIGVPKRTGIGATDFREFCERAAGGDDPNEESFTWPSSDIQAPEKLIYYQEHMDAQDYAEQYEATWQKAGGTVFHAYDPEYNDRSCSFHSDLPMVVGCDFNVDPMAWTMGHRCEFGIEWFDEIFIRNTNTQKTLDVLWNRYGQHCDAGVAFYGDAAGRSRQTSANMSDYLQIASDKRFKGKGATVHFPKKNPNKVDRFAATNAMFCNALGTRRMFIDPRCEHLKLDLKMRAYKKGTTETDDKGDVSHASDSFSYPLFMLYPIEGENKGKAKVIIRTPGNGNVSGKVPQRRRTGRSIPHARRSRR